MLLGVFLFGTLVGIGVELVQLTLPYRTFDVTDILVNAAGAALSVNVRKVLVGYVRFYRIRRLERRALK